MYELTGEQRETLRLGLQRAFPEHGVFEIFLSDKLEKKLLHYASPSDTLPVAVFRVLDSAASEGWLGELVAAARKNRPRNSQIARIAGLLDVGSAVAGEHGADADVDTDAPDTDTPRSEPLWRTLNPYRGLAALREQDANFLFGRDDDILGILDAIANERGQIFLALGDSGVGKSSLIFAGVLAALNRQILPGRREWPVALSGSSRWPHLTLTPGTEPVRSLAGAFVRQWMDDTGAAFRTETNNWSGLLNSGDSLDGLVNAADAAWKRREQDPPGRYLIYVDQGEELYTRGGRDPGRDGSRQETPQQRQARRFSELLAEAAAHPRLIVIMSARSDFLGRLQADTPLHQVRHQIDITPLSEAQLLEAARRPAEILGVRFENGLAEALVASAREQAGGLPLLSDTLAALWNEMQTREGAEPVLRWNGAPAETIEVAHKLIARADAFVSAHRGQESAIRRLFCIRLAHVPQQGQPTRQRAFLDDLTETERALIAELASPEQRILATGSIDGASYAEVAHEALFAAWTALGAWIGERRGFYAWVTQVTAERQDWEKEGKPSAGLLSGRPLERARAFLETDAEDIAECDAAFIRRSAERDRRRKLVVLSSVTAAVAALLWTAVSARRAAYLMQDIVEQLRKTAKGAQLDRPRYKVGFASESLQRGDVGNAVGLARAALPAKLDRSNGQPVVMEAFNTLCDAYSRKGYALRTLIGHEARGHGALELRDGRLLTWSGDKTARLWAADGTPIRVLEGHEATVTGALELKDGRLLTWSEDKTARLWAANGTPVRVVIEGN